MSSPLPVCCGSFFCYTHFSVTLCFPEAKTQVIRANGGPRTLNICKEVCVSFLRSISVWIYHLSIIREEITSTIWRWRNVSYRYTEKLVVYTHSNFTLLTLDTRLQPLEKYCYQSSKHRAVNLQRETAAGSHGQTPNKNHNLMYTVSVCTWETLGRTD